jgi:hypothetical protein
MATDCKMFAYRESFFEMDECNQSLHGFLLQRQSEGLMAFGGCRRIEIAGERI